MEISVILNVRELKKYIYGLNYLLSKKTITNNNYNKNTLSKKTTIHCVYYLVNLTNIFQWDTWTDER